MHGRLKNQSFFDRFNRVVFPLFYLRHQKKADVVVRAGAHNQFKVRVNSSDILLIWEIWRFRLYEDARLPIRAQDTVVDIGAHIGVFAVWAAQRAHEGRVYAYEASPENYKYLVENKRLNEAHNLHIQNQAVFDRPGKHALYSPGGNGALGSLLQDPGSPKEIVTAITLDTLFDNHQLDRIDLLKLDVEGAEYPILLKSSAETLRRVRNLVLEYHELEGVSWRPADLERQLRSFGFQVSTAPGLWGQKKLFGTGMMLATRV
jgi:FkbM family methyltransferase